MNILDENIIENQRELLRSWRIHVRQVGHDIAHKGISDEEIISLLHRMPRPTFFTGDLGFYARPLCHANYGLVCLAVSKYDTAFFIRRFLRHSGFGRKSKRLGCVFLVGQTGIRFGCLRGGPEEAVGWK